MLPFKNIEEIAEKLSAILPEGVSGVKSDMEANFKAVLQSAFAQMDLVTREEFDVQTQVLNRTRQKLEDLEAKVSELEKMLSTQE